MNFQKSAFQHEEVEIGVLAWRSGNQRFSMKNGISALQNAEREITFDGINNIFCFCRLFVIQISYSVLILLDSFLVFVSFFTQRVKMDRLTVVFVHCCLDAREGFFTQNYGNHQFVKLQNFWRKKEKEGIALPFCTTIVHQNHYYDSIQRIGDFNSKDTFTLRFGC